MKIGRDIFLYRNPSSEGGWRLSLIRETQVATRKVSLRPASVLGARRAVLMLRDHWDSELAQAALFGERDEAA